MLIYKITDPYFSLIVAKDATTLCDYYETITADIDDRESFLKDAVTTVSKAEAIQMLIQADDIEPNIDQATRLINAEKQLTEVLNDTGSTILLIDGNLL